MSRYRGPKLRIIRRLGDLPGFTSKITKRTNPPGQHGPAKANKKSNTSEYGIRLQEKQKLRFNYGVSEKQLYSYVKEARRLKGATGVNLLKLLEMRLDNIIYRLGVTPTITSARQFVTHGHILINGKKVNIPSFQCKVNDIISIRNKPQSIKLAKQGLELNTSNLLGSYLDFDNLKLIGKINSLVSREDVMLNINELFIVEFYSRK
jgi:small subunit ribosomal protein S4